MDGFWKSNSFVLLCFKYQQLTKTMLVNLERFLGTITLSEWTKNYRSIKPHINHIDQTISNQLVTAKWVHEQLQNPDIYKTCDIFLRTDSFKNMDRVENYNSIIEGLDSGKTLQIRNLESILPMTSPLLTLAHNIEKTLLFRLNSITYFQSRPGSIATAIHKDISEIFSIQLAGKKLWKFANKRDLTEKMCYLEKDINFAFTNVMKAGDVVYSPCYLPHQVQCIEEESISVAMVFSCAEYRTLWEIIKSNPELNHWLHRSTPPLGNSINSNGSEEDFKEFKELLVKNINEFSFQDFQQIILEALKTEN